jgi:hypothetical protein
MFAVEFFLARGRNQEFLHPHPTLTPEGLECSVESAFCRMGLARVNLAAPGVERTRTKVRRNSATHYD